MIKFDFIEKFNPGENVKTSQNFWEFSKYVDWIKEEFKDVTTFKYLEIGTYAGESLYYMAQILPPKSDICLLDLPTNESARKCLIEKVIPWVTKTYGHRIALVSGDSTNPEAPDKVAKFASGGKFHLLFIDANHEFQYCLNDFVRFRHLVQWISFHDISRFNTVKTKIKYNTIQANANHVWEVIKVIVPEKQLVNTYSNTEVEPSVRTNWLEFIAYDNKLDFLQEVEAKDLEKMEKPRGIGVLRSVW